MPASFIRTRVNAIAGVAILGASSPLAASDLSIRAREAGTRVSLRHHPSQTSECSETADAFLKGGAVADSSHGGYERLLLTVLPSILGLVVDEARGTSAANGDAWLIGGSTAGPLVTHFITHRGGGGADPPPLIVKNQKKEERDCFSKGYRAQSLKKDNRTDVLGVIINALIYTTKQIYDRRSVEPSEE